VASGVRKATVSREIRRNSISCGCSSVIHDASYAARQSPTWQCIQPLRLWHSLAGFAHGTPSRGCRGCHGRKPNSVPKRLRLLGDHFSGTSVAERLLHATRSSLRTTGTGEPVGAACVCTRWGLPYPGRCRPRGALLPHRFTLTSDAKAPDRRCTFCCTFPDPQPGRWALPTTVSCRVRTFLQRGLRGGYGGDRLSTAGVYATHAGTGCEHRLIRYTARSPRAHRFGLGTR
jgi:hypothetical protein